MSDDLTFGENNKETVGTEKKVVPWVFYVRASVCVFVSIC